MFSRAIVCRTIVSSPPTRIPINRHLNQLKWKLDYCTKPPGEGPPTVRRLWKLLFGRYLLATNTITSGLLMLVGDLAAQKIEQRQQNAPTDSSYDGRRVFNMTLVGLSQGPLHHYLYKWMDVLLPGASVRTVFKKIGIDQVVISPIFIITYMYSAGLLEGASVAACTDELRQKYWTIYLADWLVWPPTQFINFYLLSPKYRVLYINGITMLYNVFLCYIKHNDDLVSLVTGNPVPTKEKPATNPSNP